MAYAEHCLLHPDQDFEKNTGVSLTSPVYFNDRERIPVKPIISKINVQFVDGNNLPVKSIKTEIWNIDEKIGELESDSSGTLRINAPATIDLRYQKPDGTVVQKWLFYEYPPILNLIEDTYTVSWAGKYPGIPGGFMPWEAFHYDETRKILEEVNWTINLDE